MAPTAFRQPFLCARQHHPRRTVAGIAAAEAHQSRSGQNWWPRMGMRGAFGWLRRVSTN